jgi:phosphate uptake regulator
MLDDVLRAVAVAHDSVETRQWCAAAVLVGRHLERVANNAAELGSRVRFLSSGELFTRAARPSGE